MTNAPKQRVGQQRAVSAGSSNRWVAGLPRDQQMTVAALVLLTVAAIAIRAQGFSSLDLFRDDAWVALSSKTGLGTAWHMWVAAPGFSFLEREFILIGPHATWWDQIPPFVAGVLGVGAIFAVCRHFLIDRIGGIVAAVLVCVSPICIIYSTRVKEYSLDFLLTCALLVVAETARRTRGRRQMAICAAVSVIGFLMSASTAVVIVGVWLVLGLLALKDRSRLKSAVALGAVAAAGCALVAAPFYTHISPSLNRFWNENGGFIQRDSVPHVVSSTFHTGWNLISGVFGFAAFPTAVEALILVAWLALSCFAVYRDRALVVPAVAFGLAFVGSIVHVLPLGTGRTDEYLYPVLLLLPVAGGVQALRLLAESIDAGLRQAGQAAPAVVAGVALVLSLVLIGRAETVTPPYPGVAVQQLAAAIHGEEQPGDHVYVNEVMRYPWALYESDPLQVRLGGDWSTNFTVISTDPGVFIDPSEDYEGDQHPKQWAKAMSRYTRLWYVWSPPLSLFSFSYGALVGDGWHVAQTITEPGCAAYLLVRNS